MTDVLFRLDIDASPQTVLEAIKTTTGIRGFWTTRAEVPADVGKMLKLEFAQAPAPFDLRLEQSDDYTSRQIVVALKQYAETGRSDPVFTWHDGG